MDLLEAIKARHSVRQYTDRPIEGETLAKLQTLVNEANWESGLNMQLVLNAPDVLKRCNAQYGSYAGLSNFIALVGSDDADLEEDCGYYGERIVLEAQRMGLNTCWMCFSWRNTVEVVKVRPTERLVCIIVIGYGENQGVERIRNSVEGLCRVDGCNPLDTSALPDWFLAGMEAARLAPTAMHQQQFVMEYKTSAPNEVRAVSLGGHLADVDLGIVKYHFEVGANSVNEDWEWA